MCIQRQKSKSTPPVQAGFSIRLSTVLFIGMALRQVFSCYEGSCLMIGKRHEVCNRNWRICAPCPRVATYNEKGWKEKKKCHILSWFLHAWKRTLANSFSKQGLVSCAWTFWQVMKPCMSNKRTLYMKNFREHFRAVSNYFLISSSRPMVGYHVTVDRGQSIRAINETILSGNTVPQFIQWTQISIEMIWN